MSSKMTIQDVHDKALGFKARTRDVLIRAGDTFMDENGAVVSNFGLFDLQVPAYPTKFSFGHLADFFKGTQKYPVAPNVRKAVDHLYDDCPPDVRAVVVNHWLDRISDKKLLLRGYDRNGDGGMELRAVCSDRYGVVDHHHITESILYAFQGGMDGIEVGHCGMDDATMHLRLIVPGIQDTFEFGGFRQVYQAGIYISNGCIKNRSVVVAPFIQGTSCTNSTIFATDYGLTRTHSGLSVLAARNAVYEMVGAGLRASEETMRRMFDAALVGIESPVDIIGGIMKNLGISTDGETEAKIWTGMMEQGGVNHLGLSNGLSYAAQGIKDEDTRFAMEAMAGEVIMADPDDLFGRIARVVDYAERD